METRVASAPLPSKSATKQTKTLAVTGKNRVAIEAMVWEGLKRPDAAEKAGLTDHSLYVAMTKPHVKAFYLAQCEMLRLSGKARRIHRLNEMVEQDDNKAAVVNAVALLERLGDDNPLSSLNNTRSPGVVIQILGNASVSQIDAPLTQPMTIDHESRDISDG